MNDINTQSMLRVGAMLRGIYRIEGYLASGGFGNTYVVRNVEFDEVYALKEFFIKGVCQRDDDSTSISVSNTENTECFTQQREKFKKEARRIRSLNNEHIIRVHDLFEENGTAYYVMDLVDGESLASRLKRTDEPLTEAEVNTILPQILDGLKAIHDAGIWHLDIKPANIMVNTHGVVKLIDFGASKQQSSTGGATMSTGISYTNGYAPGEQMEQAYDKFGPWTDFYALGATLYKLLTLQNPPPVTDVKEDDTEDKHEALPMPGVSAKMKRLIVWMMQDNRKHRPQSAVEIMKQLPYAAATQDDEATVIAEPYNGPSEKTATSQPKEPQSAAQTSANQPTVLGEGTRKPTVTTMAPKTSNGKSHKMLYALAAAVVVVLCALGIWALTSNSEEQTTNSVEQAQNNTGQGGPYKTFTVNGVSFDMAKVEAGTFTMGATDGDVDAYGWEKPAHQVTITKDYYMGKTEVTQALWTAVMGSNPSYFKGDNKPVEQVSWNDCQEFISKLNSLTGKTFRLPTEAEWEFAARGGNNSRHYKYSGSDNLHEVGWYTDNSSNTTHDVATKQPNELGIYDMSGNVWEWCQDWYGEYSSNAQYDPAGPMSGSDRVRRGGGWSYDAGYCRSSYRDYSCPDFRFYILGFRLCLSE